MPPVPRPRPTSVRLSDVRSLLDLPEAPGDRDLRISGVTLDSRTAQAGDLYAALPGRFTHGARFAADAVASGAVALLTDAEGSSAAGELGVPVLVVDDPRSWVGGVAAMAHGYPGSEMRIIGVTGTNGKTTVAAMIESGLHASGRVTGMIGTIGVKIAGTWFDSPRTTPEATDLHAMLAAMRDARVTDVVMEVSSIAIVEHRVDGVIYDIAAFTNLSQDHLDYHHSMDEYFRAKAALFHPTRSRHAVIGVDDEWGRRLAEQSPIPSDTWAVSGVAADWTVATSSPYPLVVGPAGERVELVVPIPGAFNVANALCALVVLLRAGVTTESAVAGIARTDVAGRMQRVAADGDVLGIVDYAHTPDAIGRVLEALRPQVGGRIIVVMGAGGDRDRGKRPRMGEVAARLADLVVITDDNPRSEDPESIRSAVLGGAMQVDAGERAELRTVADRGEAITVAVALAEAGDAVVVLGKGHERTQEAGGVLLPFDDAGALLAELLKRTPA